MSHAAPVTPGPNNPPGALPAAPGTEAPALRIGRCELRPRSRELLRDGRPQAVRPLVFDLLMALVQQRPRALSRSELMAAVWGRTVVTDSALTRTVMEARRAIGDSASAPACIATVHSYGYRFDGPVEVLEEPARVVPAPVPAAPAASTAAAPGPGRLRVGLMPCRNDTGEAALDWAPLGLMALVEHALCSEAIAWVPATTLAAALAGPQADVPTDERAAMAMAALQLDRVVVPGLRRQQRSLWLDFQVYAHGQAAAVAHGSVRETEPVALARRFAQALAPHLQTQPEGELPFFSSDGFVNQAYARAVELAAHNDYSAARPLLDTVCQLEPDNLPGALARLRVAVRMRDAQAAALGTALLSACAAAGDTALPPRVHALLWEALRDSTAPGDAARAEHHRQAASAQATARAEEGHDWFLAFLSQQGVHAMQAGRAAQARLLMDAAAEACTRAGNGFRLAVLHQNRIGLDLQAGDLLIARQRLDEAAAVHQRVRQQPVAQLHVWTMSAYVNAGLGMLDAATAQALQMLSHLGPLQHPGPACSYPFWAAQGFLDTGDARGLATALQAYAGLQAATHPAVQFGRWATEGCLRMCQGDVTAAGTLLGRALDVAQAAGGVAFMHECAKLLLRLESAIGNPDHLRALCERTQALPGAADNLPVQWALAHAHAAELLLRGDRAGALQQLQELIASSATGRENACARLDAAWLCCEQGDLERASRLLAGAGRWRQEHPSGLATEARLLMSARRFEPAARLLRAAIERHQGLAPHWHHELLRCCEQAHAGPGRVQWRQLPRLASSSWQRGIVAAPTRRLQPRTPAQAVGDRRRLPMPAVLPLAALATPPSRSSAPLRP